MNTQIQGHEGLASMNPWSLWSRAHPPPLHNNSLHEASQTFPHIVLTCQGGWAIFSKSDLSKLPGNFTSHKCFFDIYDVCSKTAGRKQQMETETGRKWGNAMGKSVKKWFQFRILVCGTPFCCSCLSSHGGCHRRSLVWASCLIPISASHLVWFWPGGLCWEPLLPGLT